MEGGEAPAPAPEPGGGAPAAVPGASKFRAAPKLGAKAGGPLKLVPLQHAAVAAPSKLDGAVLPHTVPPRTPAQQAPLDQPAPKPVPRLVKPPPQKHASPAPSSASALDASADWPAAQAQAAAPKRPKPPSYPPPGFEVQSKAGPPPNPGQRVVISNFPRDLQALPRSDLTEHIRVQLEAFGKLSTAPFVTPSLDGRTRAVATFEDVESARLAAEALSGTVFDVALGAARRPAREAPTAPGGGAAPARLAAALYLDELEMPLRPEVPATATDREVWAALPADARELAARFAAFGEAEDVLRAAPDPRTGAPAAQGYVRFREHAAAEACVRAGAGAWSESERALASRLPPRRAAVRAYPQDVLALLLGGGGAGEAGGAGGGRAAGPEGPEDLAALQKRCGLERLALLGPGLGGGAESERLRFEAEGEEAALAALRPELEMRLAAVHGAVCAHLERLGLNWLDDREAERGEPRGPGASERPAAQHEAAGGGGECREPPRKRPRPLQQHPAGEGEPEGGRREPRADPALSGAPGLDGAPRSEGS